MSFDPLQKKGFPLEKQLRNWSELNVKFYDKQSVHPLWEKGKDYRQELSGTHPVERFRT